MPQEIDVVVDVREPPELLDAFERHPDVASVTFSTLPTADIVIGEIGFERKTPSDFASSMTDRDEHLRNQIAKMTEAFDVSYVLVEGEMLDFSTFAHTGVNPASVRGFAASVEMRHGVRVHFCSAPDPSERYRESFESQHDLLVDTAVRLARKATEDETSSVLRVDSASGLDAPFMERFWGLIDGVGPKTATVLADAFPTVESALRASTDDLEALDGVGPKTAETIRETLVPADATSSRPPNGR